MTTLNCRLSTAYVTILRIATLIDNSRSVRDDSPDYGENRLKLGSAAEVILAPVLARIGSKSSLKKAYYSPYCH